MENVLITGGAGFIGSHVCRHLLKTNRNIVVLDDLSGGSRDNLPKGATFIEGSVNDAVLIESLFDQYKFDYVFHLAAYAAESRSHFLRSFTYRNNLIGSTNLINASVNHGLKCFVFTSSIAVYGDQKPPVTESLKPAPIDPYGIAKYAVELDLEAAKEVFDLDYIIFRPHNVYGPYQNLDDPDRNVVGIFMKQLLSDEAMTIVGDGKQSRAFSFVDDVAPIIARSIDTPAAYNQIFNLGSDATTSINELATAVAKALKKEVKMKGIPGRKEVQHAYATHEKMRKDFGLKEEEEETLLEKGLAAMATWAKQQTLSEPNTTLENEIKIV